jgi:hypothetical protein
MARADKIARDEVERLKVTLSACRKRGSEGCHSDIRTAPETGKASRRNLPNGLQCTGGSTKRNFGRKF